jgi:hypothetical protein
VVAAQRWSMGGAACEMVRGRACRAISSSRMVKLVAKSRRRGYEKQQYRRRIRGDCVVARRCQLVAPCSSRQSSPWHRATATGRKNEPLAFLINNAGLLFTARAAGLCTPLCSVRFCSIGCVCVRARAAPALLPATEAAGWPMVERRRVARPTARRPRCGAWCSSPSSTPTRRARTRRRTASARRSPTAARAP